jgi:hypothetical protein
MKRLKRLIVVYGRGAMPQIACWQRSLIGARYVAIFSKAQSPGGVTIGAR